MLVYQSVHLLDAKPWGELDQLKIMLGHGWMAGIFQGFPAGGV